MTTPATSNHVTVKLAYPIRPVAAKGELVSELKLRRVKGRDLRAIEPLSAQQSTFKLIEILSTPQLTAEDVDDLDHADILALDRVISGFSQSGSEPSPAAASST